MRKSMKQSLRFLFLLLWVLSAVPVLAQVVKATVKIDGMI